MPVSINGTNGLVFPDGSTQGTAAPGRNKIINGAMQIDQRNAGSSVALSGTTSTYVLDRWNEAVAGGVALTVQRSTVVPAGFVNSKLITITTADSSLAAADYAVTLQNIEGFNCADLGFGTANAKSVTLSFWVRCSVTGTYGVALRNGAGDRSYVASYVINAANTWEYKSITIPGDTTGTWATNNTTGMAVLYDLGTGSTFSTSAGSWSAGNFFGLTGGTKLSATNGATLYLTGVQLEKGTAASDFEHRQYGTELALCQRYFESSMTVAPADSMAVAETGGVAIGNGNATPVFSFPFNVRKRASATVTYYSPLTSSPSGKVREGPTGTIRNVTGGLVTAWGAVIGVTSGAANTDFQFGYHASAEL